MYEQVNEWTAEEKNVEAFIIANFPFDPFQVLYA